MPDTHLSPDLSQEVISALEAFAKSRDADSEAKLARVTARICTEAHARGLTPESMIIGIKRIFTDWQPHASLTVTSGQLAFDALVSRCIQAYFNHPHPPRP